MTEAKPEVSGLSARLREVLTVPLSRPVEAAKIIRRMMVERVEAADLLDECGALINKHMTAKSDVEYRETTRALFALLSRLKGEGQ